MIFFFGGLDIAVLLSLLIAVAAGGAQLIAQGIGILIFLFAVKNFVQTVIFGYFKRKNTLPLTIGYITIDFLRVWIFFSSLKDIATTFSNATGLKFFGALFGLIAYFGLAGSIFCLGEIISSIHHVGNQDMSKKFGIGMDIFLIVLLALVTWIGYL